MVPAVALDVADGEAIVVVVISVGTKDVVDMARS